MKVSVIIPCYNFEKYIEEALLSVISQKTNFEYEILVRDDGSSDRSIDCIDRVCMVCKNAADIKNFSHTYQEGKNLGLKGMNNFKFLLDNAKGEYIAYMDGDDYWVDPYKLQRQIDFLDRNKDYVMTFTAHWQKNDNGKYEPEEHYNWFGLPLNMFPSSDVETKDLLNQNWVVYGRVFKNMNGIIKDWMHGLPILDWPINYEYSKIGKIKYIDFPSGVYRIHNSSTFGILADEEKNKQVNETREAIRKNYKQSNPDYDLNSPVIGM